MQNKIEMYKFTKLTLILESGDEIEIGVDDKSNVKLISNGSQMAIVPNATNSIDIKLYNSVIKKSKGSNYRGKSL